MTISNQQAIHQLLGYHLTKKGATIQDIVDNLYLDKKEFEQIKEHLPTDLVVELEKCFDAKEIKIVKGDEVINHKKRTYKSVVDQVDPVDYGFKLKVSEMNKNTIEYLYSLDFGCDCIDIRIVKDTEGNTIEEPIYCLYIDNSPESGGNAILNVNTFADITTIYRIITGDQLKRTKDKINENKKLNLLN